MAEHYVIIVKGHVNNRYFAWCDSLSITHTEDGETLLFGAVRDQAELHGLLAQIRDLSLTLIAVNRQGYP